MTSVTPGEIYWEDMTEDQQIEVVAGTRRARRHHEPSSQEISIEGVAFDDAEDEAGRPGNVTVDQLRAAAEYLGVPWDRGALRPDGTPWWAGPEARHVLDSSWACSCEQDGVMLFFDADRADLSAPEDHPVWAAITEPKHAGNGGSKETS